MVIMLLTCYLVHMVIMVLTMLTSIHGYHVVDDANWYAWLSHSLVTSMEGNGQ